MPFCSHTIDGLLNFENFGKYRVSNFENFGELEQTNFEEKKYRDTNACLLGHPPTRLMFRWTSSARSILPE